MTAPGIPRSRGQYECLARIIGERNPQRIGLNVSRTFAFGDGLSHGDYEDLSEALGPDIMARTESAERLAVGWAGIPHQGPSWTVYPSIAALGPCHHRRGLFLARDPARRDHLR